MLIKVGEHYQQARVSVVSHRATEESELREKIDARTDEAKKRGLEL